MWTSNEPQYGDHGQLLAQDGWVYVYGGTNTTKYYDGVYVMRVPHESQQDLDCYEYWNGTQFTKERVYDPREEQAILGPGSSQGTVSSSLTPNEQSGMILKLLRSHGTLTSTLTSMCTHVRFPSQP